MERVEGNKVRGNGRSEGERRRYRKSKKKNTATSFFVIVASL